MSYVMQAKYNFKYAIKATMQNKQKYAQIIQTKYTRW